MPYYPPEVVERARQMDLLTYLRTYEPYELVPVGSNTFCTREHDSLKISNGKWCWFSRGIGGKTALDYLIKVKEIPFTDAVGMIVGQGEAVMPAFRTAQEKPKEKILLLPESSVTTERVCLYLKNRGIDEEIIDYCLSTGRLYESEGRYHNAVFVGYDRYEKARYANIRGIGTEFKGECTGSDKRFSFNIPAKNSSTVNLFESAIDLLSYATLLKLNGRDWKKEHLLSLAGVYRPRKDSGGRIPMALAQYLKDYPQVKLVTLRLDNDYTGRMATKAIRELLPVEYTSAAFFPPSGKDYNDYLCSVVGWQGGNRKQQEQER